MSQISPRRIVLSVGMLVLYAFCYALFFFPAVFGHSTLASGDVRFYYYPFLMSGSDLWEPLILGGFPVFADIQSMRWYPLAILFGKLLNSWSLLVFSAHLLACLSTFALMYRYTRLIFASWIAGLVYGLGGFMMAHTGHTTVIHAAAWLPLLILSFDALRERISPFWFLAATFSVGCTLLGGHPQTAFYSVATASIYAMVFGWSAKIGRWKYYGLLAIVGLLGIGMTSIQLLPTLELSKICERADPSLNFFKSYSLSPFQLVLYLFPLLFDAIPPGNWLSGDNPCFTWNPEPAGYIGILPLLFAAVGCWFYRKEPVPRFWFFVLVISLALAVSGSTPLASLLFKVPVYRLFRASSRHLLEASFAFALLAGFGVATVSRGFVGKKIPLVVAASLFSVMAISIVYVNVFKDSIYKALEEMKILTLPPSFLPWDNRAVWLQCIMLLLSVTVFLIMRWKPGSPIIRMALVAVVLFDLCCFACIPIGRELSDDPLGQGGFNPKLKPYVDTVRSEGQRIFPLLFNARSMLMFKPNASILLDAPSVVGYTQFTPKYLAELLVVTNKGEPRRFSCDLYGAADDVLSVRYLLFPKEYRFFLSPISKEGADWSTTPFQLELGADPERKKKPSWTMTMPWPVKATAVGIVSQLWNALRIPDDTPVLEVTVMDLDGREYQQTLLAGRDTSNAVYGPSYKAGHRQAKVFESKPGTTKPEDTYYSYVCFPSWKEPIQVKSLQLRWIGPPEKAYIMLSRLTWLNEESGNSYPSDERLLALSLVPDHWRYLATEDKTAIFENLRAMPRACLVGDVKTVSAEQALKTIRTGHLPDKSIFDPQRTALLETEDGVPYSLSNPELEGTAQLVKLEKDRILVRCKADSKALLVLSDVYYPGWQALVDGVPTPIYRTNHAFRGIPVEPGEHEVELTFKPRSFRLGASFSVASLLLLFGLAAVLEVYDRRVRKSVRGV